MKKAKILDKPLYKENGVRAADTLHIPPPKEGVQHIVSQDRSSGSNSSIDHEWQ